MSFAQSLLPRRYGVHGLHRRVRGKIETCQLLQNGSLHIGLLPGFRLLGRCDNLVSPCFKVRRGFCVVRRCGLRRMRPAPAILHFFRLPWRSLGDKPLENLYGHSAIHDLPSAFHPFQHGLERSRRAIEVVQAPLKEADKDALYETAAPCLVIAEVQLFLMIHLLIIPPDKVKICADPLPG